MPESAPVAQTQMTKSALDHLDPWKDDGNIVLAAQGKCFRVHRSILCAYSEVFKDMFACSHLNEAEEFIEQCPVIHLHDAASDVQILLKALYDRRSAGNAVSYNLYVADDLTATPCRGIRDYCPFLSLLHSGASEKSTPFRCSSMKQKQNCLAPSNPR